MAFAKTSYMWLSRERLGVGMIRYSLQCHAGHAFESWFRDSAAYDSLREAGALSCATCGSTDVEKALMAPALASGRTAPEPPGAGSMVSATADSPLHEALAALRREIEAKADYVGPRFAEEARRIHEGDADARAIWGEATGTEARALVEDGIPVAPLPWLVRRDD